MKRSLSVRADGMCVSASVRGAAGREREQEKGESSDEGFWGKTCFSGCEIKDDVR